MAPLSVRHPDGRDAFVAQLERFVALCGGLSDHDLLGPSRCWGWAALDVVVHVRAGLQEMLEGVVSRCDDPPTTDAAGYWRASPPAADDEADEVDGVLWLRRTAAAYRRPRTAVAHLRDVADALSSAATAMPDRALRFQGHVLSSGDFLATWAVELAVHHLDVTVDLGTDGGSLPTPPALALARRTVEALLDEEIPPPVTDVRAVLLGTGRAVPDAGEATLLGDLAGRLPVLG